MSLHEDLEALMSDPEHYDIIGPSNGYVSVDNLRAVLAEHPAPGTEWGVATKWGHRPNSCKEFALREVAFQHKHGEQARLVQRTATLPGPWEESGEQN